MSRNYPQEKCRRIRALQDKDEEDEKSRKRTVSMKAAGLTSLNPQRSLKWKLHSTMIPKLGR